MEPRGGREPGSAGIDALVAAGRSIKLDVKENGDTLRETLDIIDALALSDDRVWFNAEIEVVGPAGFESFLTRYPDATASCPTDFIVPLLAAAPDEADKVLERLRSWGLSRLSVRWGDGVRWLIGELEERGWETNIYGVPDLQSFLEAALLLPTSVTADFNFPLWNHFGRDRHKPARSTDIPPKRRWSDLRGRSVGPPRGRR